MDFMGTGKTRSIGVPLASNVFACSSENVFRSRFAMT